jgi:phosphatidylglycerol lysyltransferase
MTRTLQRVLAGLATASLFCIALFSLHRSLAGTSLAEIGAQVRSVAPLDLLQTGLLTAASFASLTLYDLLALRQLGRHVPYRRVALTAFSAYALANTLGLSSLSAGSVRLRAYTQDGLSAFEIAQLQALCTLTFLLGVVSLTGLSLLFAPDSAALARHVSPAGLRLLGAMLLAGVAGYVVFTWVRRRPLRFRKWTVAIPTPAYTLAQLAVGSVDLCCAAGCLYVLLPASSGPPFPVFVAAYLLAVVAGVVSAVPGGAGVFESTLLLLLPTTPAHELLGAIVVYRLTYYLGPFLLALVVLLVRELHPIDAMLTRGARATLLAVVTPRSLAALVFAAGVVLLVSGSLPAGESRIERLRQLLPLPLLEVSHLVGSASGVALLLLANGLRERLRDAYRVTQLLLGGAIVASLLKGFDYEQGILLSALMGLLYAARGHFVRESALSKRPFAWSWLRDASLVLGGAVWLGFVAHRRVQYADELWWRFAFDADASRMLRASVLCALLLGSYALRQLLSPLQPPKRSPDAADLERAAACLAHAADTNACLALVGDKQLLFSAERDAFIMYQRSGASWIALGGPVGPQARHAELAWSFRELCDRYGGLCSFYQVRADELPLYLDLGLSLTKLGEEARVDLSAFNLTGRARAELRSIQRKAEREAMQFSVLSIAQTRQHIAELHAISNDWLSHKRAAEKGFSVGRFLPEYIARFACAVVTHQERIVAFANVLEAGGREELSIDLMRYERGAPHGVMDHLLLSLMLWGQAQGYRWFNLGMAPLSGFEQHALAPVWSKVGFALSRHGEPFYNFAGLRRYKEKFGPEWSPSYLASPGGLALPRVLLDATALIAGGLKGVVTK